MIQKAAIYEVNLCTKKRFDSTSLCLVWDDVKEKNSDLISAFFVTNSELSWYILRAAFDKRRWNALWDTFSTYDLYNFSPSVQVWNALFADFYNRFAPACFSPILHGKVALRENKMVVLWGKRSVDGWRIIGSHSCFTWHILMSVLHGKESMVVGRFDDTHSHPYLHVFWVAHNSYLKAVDLENVDTCFHFILCSIGTMLNENKAFVFSDLLCTLFFTKMAENTPYKMVFIFQNVMNGWLICWLILMTKIRTQEGMRWLIFGRKHLLLIGCSLGHILASHCMV